MKFISILFLLLLITNTVFSQDTISGQVLDSQTNQAIPYVNIGIVKLMKGTVSNQSGMFELAYQNKRDTVTFSAIGYEPLKKSVQEIMTDQSVMLKPIRYELEEITVQEKALGKLKNLGYNLKKKGESIGFGSTQLGTEIGGLIKIDRETIIYSAHFTFNNVSGNKLLFRANMYEMEDGKPGKNLIPENVLVEAPGEKGTVSVNLSSYNIVTEQSVLLSLEWVEAVSLEENEIQGITFRANKTRRNPNAWFRSTSLAPFMKMDQFVKYNLGFYVEARQVKK